MATSPNSSEMIAEMANRSTERTRLLEEIEGLKQQLTASRSGAFSEGDFAEEIQALEADRDTVGVSLSLVNAAAHEDMTDSFTSR